MWRPLGAWLTTTRSVRDENIFLNRYIYDPRCSCCKRGQSKRKRERKIFQSTAIDNKKSARIVRIEKRRLFILLSKERRQSFLGEHTHRYQPPSPLFLFFTMIVRHKRHTCLCLLWGTSASGIHNCCAFHSDTRRSTFATWSTSKRPPPLPLKGSKTLIT